MHFPRADPFVFISGIKKIFSHLPEIQSGALNDSE
jgi:hypothetical protein